MALNINLILIIALAIACGGVVLSLILGIARVMSKKNREEELHDIIDNLSRSEIALERQDSDIPDPKTWEGYWYALANNAGTKFESKATPGLLAAGVAIALFGIGFFVWPADVFGGLIGIFVGLFLVRTLFLFKKTARLKLMDKQLPNLLAGLRASLQANLTPQQAIIDQSKDFPSPLGEELRIMTNEMALGVTLDQSLRNFSSRVASKEIKFLVSATRIAIASGADLDPQLEIIQRIVVERTAVANMLASAIAKASPSIWVTGIMIPGGVLYSFYSSPQNQGYWLSVTGLIALVIIAGLYVLGLFIARKQVDGIKKA